MASITIPSSFDDLLKEETAESFGVVNPLGGGLYIDALEEKLLEFSDLKNGSEEEILQLGDSFCEVLFHCTANFLTLPATEKKLSLQTALDVSLRLVRVLDDELIPSNRSNHRSAAAASAPSSEPAVNISQRYSGICIRVWYYTQQLCLRAETATRNALNAATGTGKGRGKARGKAKAKAGKQKPKARGNRSKSAQLSEEEEEGEGEENKEGGEGPNAGVFEWSEGDLRLIALDVLTAIVHSRGLTFLWPMGLVQENFITGAWTLALRLLNERPPGISGTGHKETAGRWTCVDLIVGCISLFNTSASSGAVETLNAALVDSLMKYEHMPLFIAKMLSTTSASNNTSTTTSDMGRRRGATTHLNSTSSAATATSVGKYANLDFISAELLHEISNMNTGSMPTLGLKNIAQFVELFAKESPSLVQRYFPILLPQLDSPAHQMRSAMLQTMGHLVIHIHSEILLRIGQQTQNGREMTEKEHGEEEEKNSNREEKEVDEEQDNNNQQHRQQNPAQLQRFRDSLLDVLVERAHDVNPFTRAVVLKIWITLLEASALPVNRVGVAGDIAVDRLSDKNAFVRRAATALLTSVLENNPFAGTLDRRVFAAQLAQSEEALKDRILDLELRAKESEEDAKLHREVANGTMSLMDGMDEEDAVEQQQQQQQQQVGVASGQGDGDATSDEFRVQLAQAIAQQEADAANAPVLSASALLEDSEVRDLKKQVEFCSACIAFVSAIESALPKLQEMLQSKNTTDTVEALRFYARAVNFRIQGAMQSYKSAFSLIWHSEANIRAELLTSFAQVFFTDGATLPSSTSFSTAVGGRNEGGGEVDFSGERSRAAGSALASGTPLSAEEMALNLIRLVQFCENESEVTSLEKIIGELFKQSSGKNNNNSSSSVGDGTHSNAAGKIIDAAEVMHALWKKIAPSHPQNHSVSAAGGGRVSTVTELLTQSTARRRDSVRMTALLSHHQQQQEAQNVQNGLSGSKNIAGKGKKKGKTQVSDLAACVRVVAMISACTDSSSFADTDDSAISPEKVRLVTKVALNQVVLFRSTDFPAMKAAAQYLQTTPSFLSQSLPPHTSPSVPTPGKGSSNKCGNDTVPSYVESESCKSVLESVPALLQIISGDMCGNQDDETSTRSWYGACEEAMHTLFHVHPSPDRLLDAVLSRMFAHLLSSSSGSSAQNGAKTVVNPIALSRFLFALGQAAICTVVYAETLANCAKKCRSNGKKGGGNGSGETGMEGESDVVYDDTVGADEGEKGGENEVEEGGAGSMEEEMGMAAAADADHERLLNQITEYELVVNNLLGKFYPFLTQIVLNPRGLFSHPLLREAAVLTLCRYMSTSSVVCEKALPLLFTVLERGDAFFHSPSAPAASRGSIGGARKERVKEGREGREGRDTMQRRREMESAVAARTSIMIALGDLAFRFPNTLEPWTEHMYSRLSDESPVVRYNCLMVITHLVLNDMIKVKGQVSHVALCLTDAEPQMRDLSRLLFIRLSERSNNPVYNLLGDIISTFSQEQEQTEHDEGKDGKDLGTSDGDLVDENTGTVGRNGNKSSKKSQISDAAPGKAAIQARKKLTKEEFQATMHFLLSFVQKDKQADTLLERLMLRIGMSKSLTQKRNLAFCVSELTITEKGVKRMIDLIKNVKDALYDTEVHEYFKLALSRAKRGARFPGSASAAAAASSSSHVNDDGGVGVGDGEAAGSAGGVRGAAGVRSAVEEMEELMLSIRNSADGVAAVAVLSSAAAHVGDTGYDAEGEEGVAAVGDGAASARNAKTSSGKQQPKPKSKATAPNSKGRVASKRNTKPAESSSDEDDDEDDDEEEGDSEEQGDEPPKQRKANTAASAVRGTIKGKTQRAGVVVAGRGKLPGNKPVSSSRRAPTVADSSSSSSSSSTSSSSAGEEDTEDEEENISPKSAAAPSKTAAAGGRSRLQKGGSKISVAGAARGLKERRPFQVEESGLSDSDI